MSISGLGFDTVINIRHPPEMFHKKFFLIGRPVTWRLLFRGISPQSVPHTYFRYNLLKKKSLNESCLSALELWGDLTQAGHFKRPCKILLTYFKFKALKKLAPVSPLVSILLLEESG
jgi:hypothetical protein